MILLMHFIAMKIYLSALLLIPLAPQNSQLYLLPLGEGWMRDDKKSNFEVRSV
ncbi:hypothetical protein NMYAN_130017 [Nitrosomonas nitrosa]|uniref:Uncharacterized protein n=1 Tax=Nitrosomonas nitrosa TaxID=52442 RepID=A0A8H9D863_9PROT|nr:hypothetical protein NMYAN_130017 [Nitrosomonas nitrosa]